MGINEMLRAGCRQPLQGFLRPVRQGDPVLQGVGMVPVAGHELIGRHAAAGADIPEESGYRPLFHRPEDFLPGHLYPGLFRRPCGALRNDPVGVQQGSVQIPDVCCHILLPFRRGSIFSYSFAAARRSPAAGREFPRFSHVCLSSRPEAGIIGIDKDNRPGL